MNTRTRKEKKMKKHRFFKIWGARKHKFYYLGKHRWYNPHYKGRIFYFNKKRQSFWSPAPKNSGGLKGLKSFWKKRMKNKAYYNKGKFDYLSYLRANGR